MAVSHKYWTSERERLERSRDVLILAVKLGLIADAGEVIRRWTNIDARLAALNGR